ncbi:hypothetical protein LguiA_008621 [Lonicera macranthoides]
MASQNRVSVLLSIYTLLCFLIQHFFSGRVLAQSPPAFACDVVANPAVANFTFCDQSKGIEERVMDLVSRLNLQEKIGYTGDASGNVSRFGIPRYEWWSEALHGVSFTGPGTHFSEVVPGATSFPQVILTAASFNVTLFETIGKVVSTEARAMYNVGLAGLTFWSPNVNIFRDPRWGRGQETPGEDPLLVSKYGVAYVKGLQQTDDGDKNRLKVAAACKHYTAYDVDNWKGIDRYHFNAMVTKQDLEDTFEPPFKSCVIDGNVASVMCSYNQVNGVPTCANAELLKDVIRGQWGLNGYISSDCDSLEVMFDDQHYTKTPEETVALALLAGVEVDCGTFYAQHTQAAITAGLVNESYVDMAVSHNFETLMRLGFFDGDPSKQMYGDLGPKDVCTPANQELARETARQGIVLLKNSPSSLPLSPNAIRSLAVIGPNANATNPMIGNYEGIPCGFISPLEGLTAVVPTVYEPGCAHVSCIAVMMQEITNAASTADAVVLVVGSDLSIEAESLDRLDITLPGEQQLLVTATANASKGPVILVVMSGGGMDITFAKNNPKITSIMWVGFPGQAGGAAIADVIFGFYNPSGRLPMTWYPQSYVQKVNLTTMNMRPDNATGYPGRTYRFYTGETVYQFGDGLSYSTFDHLLVEAPKRVSVPLKQGHMCRLSICKSINVAEQSCNNMTFDVHLLVRNTGQVAGSHTVLLFWSSPPVHNAPQKELVGFEKVYLEPQGNTSVKFNIDVCKHLRVVDESGNRKLALGLHLLHVGNLKHPLTVRI